MADQLGGGGARLSGLTQAKSKGRSLRQMNKMRARRQSVQAGADSATAVAERAVNPDPPVLAPGFKPPPPKGPNPRKSILVVAPVDRPPPPPTRSSSESATPTGPVSSPAADPPGAGPTGPSGGSGATAGAPNGAPPAAAAAAGGAAGPVDTAGDSAKPSPSGVSMVNPLLGRLRRHSARKAKFMAQSLAAKGNAAAQAGGGTQAGATAGGDAGGGAEEATPGVERVPAAARPVATTTSETQTHADQSAFEGTLQHHRLSAIVHGQQSGGGAAPAAPGQKLATKLVRHMSVQTDSALSLEMDVQDKEQAVAALRTRTLLDLLDRVTHERRLLMHMPEKLRGAEADQMALLAAQRAQLEAREQELEGCRKEMEDEHLDCLEGLLEVAQQLEKRRREAMALEAELDQQTDTLKRLLEPPPIVDVATSSLGNSTATEGDIDSDPINDAWDPPEDPPQPPVALGPGGPADPGSDYLRQDALAALAVGGHDVMDNGGAPNGHAHRDLGLNGRDVEQDFSATAPCPHATPGEGLASNPLRTSDPVAVPSEPSSLTTLQSPTGTPTASRRGVLAPTAASRSRVAATHVRMAPHIQQRKLRTMQERPYSARRYANPQPQLQSRKGPG